MLLNTELHSDIKQICLFTVKCLFQTIVVYQMPFFKKKINKSDFVGYNGYTTDKPVKENQSPRKNVSLNYNTVITKGGPTKLQL